jgi:hypothetical protein
LATLFAFLEVLKAFPSIPIDADPTQLAAARFALVLDGLELVIGPDVVKSRLARSPLRFLMMRSTAKVLANRSSVVCRLWASSRTFLFTLNCD